MYQVTLYKDAADKVGTVVQASFVDQVISDGQIGIGINVSDKFTFKIYPFAYIYNLIAGMVSFYKVESEIDGHEISRGRVLFIEENYDESNGYYKSVTCTSDLDYLNDSKQPFQKVQNTTPRQDFTNFINIHNQQVSAERQFKVGKLEITNSTDNVYHYVSPGSSTFATINDKLISKYGGELQIRHESDGNYIDWLNEIGIHAEQDIDVDANLQTMERKLNPSSVYSVFYPYGATVEQSGSAGGTDVASPKLTIGTVNGGRDYIERADLINQFGRISGTKSWDDVHDAQILLSKATADFTRYKPIAIGYQIKAINLQPLGLAVDSFSVGNYHHLINNYIGIDDELRIATIALNLDNPETDTLTIGDRELTLAEYQSNQQRTLSQFEQLNGTISDQQNKIVSLTLATDGLTTTAEESQKQIKTLQDQIKNLQSQIDSGSGTVSYYSGAIIDVSEWQGTIDWATVIKAGLALAVIRVQAGTSHEDLTYKTSIPNAISAGVNYAVYAYFMAVSEADAVIEATNFYNRAQAVIGTNKQPRFWMIDLEEVSMTNMQAGMIAYVNQLNKLGVPDSQIVIYSGAYFMTENNISVTRNQLWIAAYGTNSGQIEPAYRPSVVFDLWQYTSVGSIAGIAGNVDINTEPSERFKNAYLKK